MDKTEFETDLRREGYRVVNSSVKPNLIAPNHCHDFDAKSFVLGGEITITSPLTKSRLRDSFVPEQLALNSDGIGSAAGSSGGDAGGVVGTAALAWPRVLRPAAGDPDRGRV